MEIKRYEFILQADSPIAHHAETFGNTAVLMDRKMRQPDGAFVRVPVVTADSMRHALREAAAYVLLDAVGLSTTASLGEGALRLLFSGGMVTGRGDASVVSLVKFHEMSDLIPFISLFGGCADNRIIPGRLSVDDAVLMCEETKHWLPSWAEQWITDSTMLAPSRSHIEEVQRVRMDPILDPGKRTLLSSAAQQKIIKRLLKSEMAHTEDDAVPRETSKSSIMPRRFEVLVQGSLLYWSVTAACYSELDVDTFHTALGAFLARAQVGGKRGTGYGRLKPIVARSTQIQHPFENITELNVTKLGEKVGRTFNAHIKERAEKIKSFLFEVNA